MQQILQDLGIEHEPNAPLAPRTYYGVGGCAELLAHPADADQLAALVAACHEAGVTMRVLGSGANLVVADAGVDGVVVTLDKPAFRNLAIDGQVVTLVRLWEADLYLGIHSEDGLARLDDGSHDLSGQLGGHLGGRLCGCLWLRNRWFGRLCRGGRCGRRPRQVARQDCGQQQENRD